MICKKTCRGFPIWDQSNVKLRIRFEATYGLCISLPQLAKLIKSHWVYLFLQRNSMCSPDLTCFTLNLFLKNCARLQFFQFNHKTKYLQIVCLLEDLWLCLPKKMANHLRLLAQIEKYSTTSLSNYFVLCIWLCNQSSQKIRPILGKFFLQYKDEWGIVYLNDPPHTDAELYRWGYSIFLKYHREPSA